jgi:hypothetical protein
VATVCTAGRNANIQSQFIKRAWEKQMEHTEDGKRILKKVCEKRDNIRIIKEMESESLHLPKN